MLNNIKLNPDFKLVTRKQVDSAPKKAIVAAVYRAAKGSGFEYAVEVTRSVQASYGEMVDIESLSLCASSIDKLIAELQAAKEVIMEDMTAHSK